MKRMNIFTLLQVVHIISHFLSIIQFKKILNKFYTLSKPDFIFKMTPNMCRWYGKEYFMKIYVNMFKLIRIKCSH